MGVMTLNIFNQNDASSKLLVDLKLRIAGVTSQLVNFLEDHRSLVENLAREERVCY